MLLSVITPLSTQIVCKDIFIAAPLLQNIRKHQVENNRYLPAYKIVFTEERTNSSVRASPKIILY